MSDTVSHTSFLCTWVIRATPDGFWNPKIDDTDNAEEKVVQHEQDTSRDQNK